MASNGGNIDSSSLSLQVSTPIPISSAVTSSENTTEVSSKTNFRITFPIPIEMDANWKFEITFPSDIPIISFVEVNGYGVFGGKVNFLPNTTVNLVNNTVVVTNAASTYTTTGLDAIVEFITITNPLSTKITNSFQIFLKTSLDINIASVTTGVTYTASAGTITNMSAVPDATEVGVSTSVLFKFMPTHIIPVSSRLIITLPSETSIVAKDTASCFLSDLTQIQLTATCSVNGRQITIFNPFATDFIQDGTKIITFKINGITMPGTTAPSTAGTFQTCSVQAGTCYDIDKSTQTALLTSTFGTLTSFNVAPLSKIAYDITKYTFTFVPAHDIPVGGKILITLPSELTIPNPTFSGNSCSVIRRLNESRNLLAIGLESSFIWLCTSSTILVDEGFILSSFSAGGTITFDIQGIRNPVSLEATSSFQIKTQTLGSFVIDQITTGRFVIMTSVSPLQSVSLASTSLINGASNNVTFTVNSPSDLINGNILSITFPSQMALPTTLVWVGITNLAPSLTCSNTGQKVDISLIFSADIILLAGNSISVTVQNITNPTTTSPSDDFILLIKNVNGKIF